MPCPPTMVVVEEEAGGKGLLAVWAAVVLGVQLVVAISATLEGAGVTSVMLVQVKRMGTTVPAVVGMA